MNELHKQNDFVYMYKQSVKAMTFPPKSYNKRTIELYRNKDTLQEDDKHVITAL